MKMDIFGIIKGLILGILVLGIIASLPWIILFICQVIFYGSSSWTAPREEPGPLPLSSPNAPITRLVKTKTTIEVTLKEVLWDEGNGPIQMEERVKPVVDAVPQELLDGLHWRNVPLPKGRSGMPIDAWAVLVSVNPDVLIVTVRERPKGKYEYAFQNWDSVYITPARAHYIHQRLEFIGPGGPGDPAGRTGYELSVHAGSLVPWSDEMYVVSTDPKVEYRRLKFKNNQATVLLPAGKLVLRHHDDDVDVSRE